MPNIERVIAILRPASKAVMDLKQYFAAVVALLLALEAGSENVTLSHIRWLCPLAGDRYMKINMDNCTSDRSQCEARCDGTTSNNPMTRFMIHTETNTGKKCIQFIKKNGDSYALKVISGTNPVRLVFQRQSGDTASEECRFEEEFNRQRKKWTYKYIVNNVPMCLTRLCDGTLSALYNTTSEDRMCWFRKKGL